MNRPLSSASARDLHQELAQEVEDALIAVQKAETMMDEFGGLGDEENLMIARKRYERAVTRQRISEGRG